MQNGFLFDTNFLLTSQKTSSIDENGMCLKKKSLIENKG